MFMPVYLVTIGETTFVAVMFLHLSCFYAMDNYAGVLVIFILLPLSHVWSHPCSCHCLQVYVIFIVIAIGSVHTVELLE